MQASKLSVLGSRPSGGILKVEALDMRSKPLPALPPGRGRILGSLQVMCHCAESGVYDKSVFHLFLPI